jgi:hypothetical protein
MTAEDFEVMKNHVEKSGLKQAEYLRQVILKPRIISTEGMKEIVPELKRVGNNLNQIARAVNAGGYDPKMTDEVMRVGKELDNIWQLLRQFVAGQA